MASPHDADRPAHGRRRRVALLLLALLFACSVLVRLPSLGRPLAGHHEWVTAHTLIVLEIWARHGAGRFFHQPVITWQNPGDRGIGWQDYRLLTDPAGNFYHATYPILSYLAPHYLFQVLGVFPGVLPIQIFNLGLCALSAALLFGILLRLFRGSPHAETAALWGTAIYLFSPAVLWFQANTYFVDMLMQPLFLGCLLGGLRLLETPEQPRGWVLTAIALFLITMTEWIGVFVLVTIIALVLARGHGRAHWRGLLVLCVATGAALLLTLVLLARVRPLGEVLSFLFAKYVDQHVPRTPGAVGGLKATALYQIVRFYFWNAGPLFALLGFQLLPFALLPRLRRIQWLRKVEVRLLVLALLPVLLHHATLLTFTRNHDYSTLKAFPFLAILSAILLHRLLKTEFLPRGWRLGQAVAAALCLAASVAMYFMLNKPWAPDSSLRDLGENLGRLAAPDDVLVMETPLPTIEPQISYYAKRSILYYENEDAVWRHLDTHGRANAVLVTVDEQRHILKTRRIGLVR